MTKPLSEWYNRLIRNKLRKRGFKMLKKISGSFEEGCGILAHEIDKDSFYHLLVLKEKDTQKCFVEINNRKFYKEDLV